MPPQLRFPTILPNLYPHLLLPRSLPSRRLRLPPPPTPRHPLRRLLFRGMASSATGEAAPAAGTSGAGEASARPRRALEELAWDETFVRELPGDPRSDNIPRQVRPLPACLPALLLALPHGWRSS